MRGEKKKKVTSIFRSILAACILFSAAVVAAFAQDLGKLEGCSTSTSSCGELQNIKYPFYLHGNKPCGRRPRELFCVGNRTILEFKSAKYYVTAISYDLPRVIEVTSVDWPNRSCVLPPLSLSFQNLISPGLQFDRNTDIYYNVDPSYWVSFMNCTKSIRNPMYLPIPCLSSNNGTFVYAVTSNEAYDLNYMKPSCSYLAMAPLSSNASSQENLFQLLHKGFNFYWDDGYSDPDSGCWRTAAAAIKDDWKRNGISTSISSLVKTGYKLLICLCFFDERVYVLKLAIFLLVNSMIAYALAARFIISPIVILVFIAYKLHKMRTTVDNVEEFLQSHQTLAPRRYTYTDLIGMTSHFREKLGQGGFGSVFKGTLYGRHLVAVKMLSNAKCDGEEFINEVSTIGTIHHVNVVRLVGFCSEGSKRALVYEYMPNGSLDKYIFSSSSGNKDTSLTDEKLNEIALGIARGIDYLHQGCEVRILHFDIKPHNILLDHDLNPKVSDFGLAKLYPRDHSFLSFSVARGTVGYIAPEVISRNFGVVSFKSDVYSFGMLLMEMAGGRRNTDPRAENSSQEYYPSWIYDRLAQEEMTEFDNTSIMIGELERKLCKVGLWCIQMKPCDRPSMSQVVEMLQADIDTLQLPPKPILCSSQPRVVRQSILINSVPTDLDTITEIE